MEKRGQVYILGALIISAVIFILALKPNVIIQDKFEDDFEKLSNNYEYESTRLVNSLIHNEMNVTAGFFNLTLLFTSYSKSQNPSFNLIYAFGFNDTINIGNFMGEPIVIDDETNKYVLDGCFDKINAVVSFQGLSFESDVDFADIQECLLVIPYNDKIWISIQGLWYPFEISNKPQIIIISREEAEEQRKVFIGGEGFIPGGQTQSEDLYCNQFKKEKRCERNQICCYKSNVCTSDCD